MQARIIALNASYFLKAGGHYLISIKVSNKTSTLLIQIKIILFVSVHCLFNYISVFFFFGQASCIDSRIGAEEVSQNEVKKLQLEELRPAEQLTLEPYERDHACVIGGYRLPRKQKANTAT